MLMDDSNMLSNNTQFDSKLSIVIIGGGISGVSCVETLACLCPHVKIILISASSLLKVANNLIRFGQNIEQFDIIEESGYYLTDRHPNVQVLITKVIQLNAREHILHTENGDAIKYSKLCITTGGKPKLIDGVEEQVADLVVGIRDTETVKSFEKRLKNAKRILLVGNGGIATELVYNISHCDIIWAIKDDSIGATFFDAGAAQFFKPFLHEQHNGDDDQFTKRLKYKISNDSVSKSEIGSALGPDWSDGVVLKGTKNEKSVHIEFNCEVKRVFKNTNEFHNSKDLKDDEVWPIYIELTNSKIYGCDFVVSATGVVPNTSCILQGNNFNLSSDGGLLVNNEMLTSENDVYAAGDVCTVGWDVAPRWFQMRLWTQARIMGIYSAHCIACHLENSCPLIYSNFDIFTHVTKFFGFKVILLGLFNGQKLNNDYEVLLRVTPKQEYIKVVMKDGKMQGAILIGETDYEETFENLIINQIDLSQYGDDLLNSSIDIDDYFD